MEMPEVLAEAHRLYSQERCGLLERYRAALGAVGTSSRSDVLGLRLHRACGVTVGASHSPKRTASVRHELPRLTIRTTRWNRLVSTTIAIQAQPSSVCPRSRPLAHA
jgi:hypothetical protein